MKGRFIGDNIRLIDGIINYTSEENLPGLLLFLDWESFRHRELELYSKSAWNIWVWLVFCEMDQHVLQQQYRKLCFK